jgi:replicative DNA helicase
MTTTEQTPRDGNIEQLVMGALLLEPEAIGEVMSIITPDCFTDPRNRAAYEVMLSMYDKGQPADLYTVGRECRARKQPQSILAYLAECTGRIGSAAHVGHHCQILREKLVARQIIALGTEAVGKAMDDEVDIADTMEFLQRGAERICDLSFFGAQARPLKDAVHDALKDAEKRAQRNASGKTTGVTTGLQKLNNATAGWQAGQLIILAARPAMGKTAIMLSMAKAAAKDGVPVCLYSLEMSDISLANRMILSETNIDANKFRLGNLQSKDWAEMEDAALRLEPLPIYIDDNPVVSMRYVKTHARKMRRQGRCGMIMLDYLQLSDVSSDRRNRNREQEVAEASRQAKIIAKDLGVPFVLLSQLSRECEKRADKMPILSDLRDSGAIEQDADIVVFIHRPEYYGADFYKIDGAEISAKGLGILNIAKQRDGMTGLIPFAYNESLSKIRDHGDTYTELTDTDDDQPF